MCGSDNESTDIHRPVSSGDVGNDHVKATAVSKHRVDKGIREIQSTTRGPQHSLDDLTNFYITQDDCRELTSPASCDEYPAWLVDPDLLDIRIVKEWLQCPITGERCQQRSPNVIAPLTLLFTHEALVNDGSRTRRIRHGINTRIE
jgi:hypothetical protein